MSLRSRHNITRTIVSRVLCGSIFWRLLSCKCLLERGKGRVRFLQRKQDRRNQRNHSIKNGLRNWRRATRARLLFVRVDFALVFGIFTNLESISRNIHDIFELLHEKRIIYCKQNDNYTFAYRDKYCFVSKSGVFEFN